MIGSHEHNDTCSFKSLKPTSCHCAATVFEALLPYELVMAYLSIA